MRSSINSPDYYTRVTIFDKDSIVSAAIVNSAGLSPQKKELSGSYHTPSGGSSSQWKIHVYLACSATAKTVSFDDFELIEAACIQG